MAGWAEDSILTWFLNFEQMLAVNPQLAPVHKLFQMSPEDRSSIQKALQFNLKVRKDTYFNPQDIDNILQCIHIYNAHVLGVPAVRKGNPAVLEESGSLLTKKGYARLPNVDSVRLQEMFNYLSEQLVYEETTARTNSKLVHRDDIREKSHIAIIEESAVTNCPHFLDIVLSPDVLQIVEKEIGATPILQSLTAWWSFAGREVPTEAQNFHMDIDDFRFVKLFIYLTDVDMDSGPHTYVPGTHDREHIISILKDKQNESPEIVEWYMSKLRKTDEEVEKYIGIAPIHFEGEAGSCFLVNTVGIHKGLLPKTKDRLLLQATFGCTPTPSAPPKPIQMGTNASNNIDPNILSSPNDYISQFFVTA